MRANLMRHAGAHRCADERPVGAGLERYHRRQGLARQLSTAGRSHMRSSACEGDVDRARCVDYAGDERQVLFENRAGGERGPQRLVSLGVYRTQHDPGGVSIQTVREPVLDSGTTEPDSLRESLADEVREARLSTTSHGVNAGRLVESNEAGALPQHTRLLARVFAAV